ncbi:NAD(P)H-binding protein [Nocardioides lijunqiniae]|uniref:NAD(P)H-binding protein n=1 Tax=Nocardioides lijunqiniae TaxID=2760832 RepID=UPI0018786E13|nr:NAD(P)H-binding protein [Nocardioides lijunqiniae]
MTTLAREEKPTTRVLVTGVRGKTGVPLAELLAARPDVEVLGGSSTPSTVTADGVLPTAFSWDEPDAWPSALDGVDAVYVVRPDRVDAPALIADLLALTAPATRVVLLSERAAEDVPEGTDGWAVRAERAVRDSGRSFTILRPGWFMQVLTDPRFFLDEIAAGELRYSSGGASLAWIDARDIAAVAERALLGDSRDGEVLELTGPEALTLETTASLIAEAGGRPVTHLEIPIEEALAGTEGFERELTRVTFERVHAGTFAVVTETVERVTGRPARTLKDFLDDHRQVLSAGTGRPGARSPRS